MLHKFGEYDLHTTRHKNYLGTRYRGYTYYKGCLIAEKTGLGSSTEFEVLNWAANEIKYHKMVLEELGRITDA